ncbi:MAG: hypothetical protein GXO80_12470 [Chlorobi bacterium]|nr:hypothetical protein [Chlorobiota bacterium]
MKIKFSKEKISILVIGKKRFWIGISAGLISSVCLSFFIDYSREVMRFLSVFSEDLLILPEKEVVFFNYFFSAFSSVFGLGFTLWIWLSNPRNKRPKERLFKNLAQTNILLTTWMFWAFIARYGTIIPIVLYSVRGYDNQLDLYSDFWLLFILIPIVIFLNNWFIIRLVYKSGKWILYSFTGVIVLTLILANTKTVNRNILNDAYHKSYIEEYAFIKQELNKASLYNVNFDENTRRILKQVNTESSKRMVNDVQTAFSSNNKVTLDTLILEKIIVHNFKNKIFNLYGRNEKEKNWSYAYPVQIYKQIKMYETDCIQVQYLFEILNQMILPLNAEEPIWDNTKKYSKYQVRQFNMKYFYKYQVKAVITGLIRVVNKLKTEKQYEKYYYLLPEIKTDIFNEYHPQK